MIFFALFALSKTLRQYQKQRVSLYWFSIWTLFWLVVIFVAFLPQTTDVIARYVGIEKGADLLVYCAVVILSYGLYRVMAKSERQHQQITELVRQIAIIVGKDEQKKL